MAVKKNTREFVSVCRMLNNIRTKLEIMRQSEKKLVQTARFDSLWQVSTLYTTTKVMQRMVDSFLI